MQLSGGGSTTIADTFVRKSEVLCNRLTIILFVGLWVNTNVCVGVIVAHLNGLSLLKDVIRGCLLIGVKAFLGGAE